MQRNLNTLCEAVNVFIGQTPKLFCTHLRGISNYFIRPATDVMNIGIVFRLLFSLCRVFPHISVFAQN